MVHTPEFNTKMHSDRLSTGSFEFKEEIYLDILMILNDENVVFLAKLNVC